MFEVRYSNFEVAVDCYGLRHIASTKWGTTRYLNMDRLQELISEIA